MDSTTAAHLATLANRIDRLSPSRGRPEQFFEERDEISQDLRRIARGERSKA